jgi:hypothetical protein
MIGSPRGRALRRKNGSNAINGWTRKQRSGSSLVQVNAHRKFQQCGRSRNNRRQAEENFACGPRFSVWRSQSVTAVGKRPFKQALLIPHNLAASHRCAISLLNNPTESNIFAGQFQRKLLWNP